MRFDGQQETLLTNLSLLLWQSQSNVARKIGQTYFALGREAAGQAQNWHSGQDAFILPDAVDGKQPSKSLLCNCNAERLTWL